MLSLFSSVRALSFSCSHSSSTSDLRLSLENLTFLMPTTLLYRLSPALIADGAVGAVEAAPASAGLGFVAVVVVVVVAVAAITLELSAITDRE